MKSLRRPVAREAADPAPRSTKRRLPENRATPNADAGSAPPLLYVHCVAMNNKPSCTAAPPRPRFLASAKTRMSFPKPAAGHLVELPPRLVFLVVLLLEVGPSSPLLNPLDGAKPI